MRVLKRSPWLSGLALVVGFCALTGIRASADVATDQAGSIVIFPKVIADGERDTLIQLTNTSNMVQYVHCFYVNAGGTCEFNPDEQCNVDRDCPEWADANEHCIHVWQEEDFDLQLTRQQPTIWRVSTGRIVNPTDPANGRCREVTIGNTPRQSCPGADPGNIIPPNQPFRGELKCVLVDVSGHPLGSNALKGEAVIEVLGTPQISEYNSINVLAKDADENLALELNNTEYNACPSQLEFVHYAMGADDIVMQDLTPDACSGPLGCPVGTVLTLIPCTENFENQVCVTTNAQLLVWDEFEQPESTSIPNVCWTNLQLSQIGDHGNVFRPSRSTFLKTQIRTSSGPRCIAGPEEHLNTPCSSDDDCGGATNGGVCGPPPGLLAVAEEFHVLPDPNFPVADIFGAAAVNVHMIGSRKGFCRGNSSQACSSDADCSAGLCRKTGTACTSDGDCDNDGSTAGLNRCDLCIIDSIDMPEVVPFPAQP